MPRRSTKECLCDRSSVLTDLRRKFAGFQAANFTDEKTGRIHRATRWPVRSAAGSNRFQKFKRRRNPSRRTKTKRVGEGTRIGTAKTLFNWKNFPEKKEVAEVSDEWLGAQEIPAIKNAGAVRFENLQSKFASRNTVFKTIKSF